MSSGNQTLYEVLGVGRRAKAAEIDRAYARVRSEMRQEAAAPDPKRAAMAKVAYHTLSDPGRRSEYDESLGLDEESPGFGEPASEGLKLGRPVILLVVVAALAAGGYYAYDRFAPVAGKRGPEPALGPAELLQAVSPQLGRVRGALMSGEVRDLGMAVESGENEMVTTCRGISAQMALSVEVAGHSAKAEIARAHDDLDICVLAVKGASPGIKTRAGVPPPQEKLQAVLVGPKGAPEARQVTVSRAIPDPGGPMLELAAGAALPNGTPIFDAQSRLVGIVTAPHARGEGVVAALGGARIARARGEAAAPAAAAAASRGAPAAQTAQTSGASPAPVESAAPAAPAEPAPRETRAAASGSEGFTSLWKEDRQGRLVEVLDDVKKGDVGNPIAYWIAWNGVGMTSRDRVQCRVTYGPDDEVVVAFEQSYPATEGYLYCALTRYQVELNDMPEGEYHFEIFVNGRGVASSSIRVEKRFFTKTMLGVLVLAVGLGLLAWLRRGRTVPYSR